MSIENGWMDDVEHIPTAAAGGYTEVPDGQMWPKFIVNHIMQGYIGTMVQWANERPPQRWIAVHFLMGRNGRIVQTAPIWTPGRHVAWGTYNLQSIGIEHEGFSIPPGYGYDYLYDAQHPWPEPMIQSTIRVQKWCMEAMRHYDHSLGADEQIIITHSMTGQPDRKDDPGALFMQQVRPRILQALAPVPPTPPEPVPAPTPPQIDPRITQARELVEQAWWKLRQLEGA